MLWFAVLIQFCAGFLKRLSFPPPNTNILFPRIIAKSFLQLWIAFFFLSIEGYDFPLYHQQIRMADDYAFHVFLSSLSFLSV